MVSVIRKSLLLLLACDNYRRECDRRRNAGQYVC